MLRVKTESGRNDALEPEARRLPLLKRSALDGVGGVQMFIDVGEARSSGAELGVRGDDFTCNSGCDLRLRSLGVAGSDIVTAHLTRLARQIDKAR